MTSYPQSFILKVRFNAKTAANRGLIYKEENMSRLSDAQYDLIYAYIEDELERRGLPADDERLRSAVFADGRIWDGDMWPLGEYISEKAEGIFDY